MIKIKTFVFNHIEVNTYVIYDDKLLEAAIVDCGCLSTQEEEELFTFITDNQLQVKHLLNTHLHLDHAFGNAYASQAFHLKPEGHLLEETTLPGLKEQAVRFGISLKSEPVSFGTYLNDGDMIELGGITLQSLHIPGHSPGGLAFYCQAGGCVFSGDALFQGSIGRTDLWGGSLNALTNAIRSKLLTLPEDTIVYPGHGAATTIGNEKRHNMYLR